MLVELRIRNVAIIDAVSLPLASGFNVLSGETGAGKSIIVGALGLLLGERGSADVIRTGADRASVEGVFDAARVPEVLAALDARGIDVEEGAVVLKREISAGGRSRAWINGTPVTATQLAEIGRALVNLHGQHESQTLLDPVAQLTILDAFAGATALREEVRTAHAELQQARGEIARLTQRKADAERRADYLRHVVKEIEDAQPVLNEDERLGEEIRRLAHVEELRSDVAQMREGLEGGRDAVLTRLSSIRRLLGAAARIDASLGRVEELLDGATYQLDELARELRDYESGLDTDPGRLAELEQRRDVLFRLTSKYGGDIAAVLRTLAESRAELDLVDTAALDLRALAERERAASAALRSAATRLSDARQAGVERLSREVSEILPRLGMTGGTFAAVLQPLPECTATGGESVEFKVALNVGHDARPLARVASGGELSRVMLALKTILSRLDETPSLVFDEVDAGIGGRVALDVGEAMRRLASHHQVLAITHLAQIAARAHHHIAVSKGARDGVTTADIVVVDGDARVTELARMLGGDPQSDVSRAHARELLQAALHPARDNGNRARARGVEVAASDEVPDSARRRRKRA